MEKKIKKRLLYEGLGFPVCLMNVPLMKTRGQWTPDIDYNTLQKAVLIALSCKSSPLTGNEIRFVRKYFGKTLESFGDEFGVSHAAVIDWEKEENQPIKINPATEKCIRLFILDSLQVSDHAFREGYQEVELKKLAELRKIKRKSKIETLTFDIQQLPLAC